MANGFQDDSGMTPPEIKPRDSFLQDDFSAPDKDQLALARILEQIAAGFNPYGPSGTANQEFKTVRAYLQNIYGPLPEGAVDYASGDLNGDKTNEVYAVDANGDPHTVYSYDDNNEVKSTVYTDYLRDTIYGGVAPQTWEDVERILRAEGYDDEAIEEVRGSIKCLTKANEIKCSDTEKFQGSVVLAGILNNSGYDGSWWDVRPTAGQPCQTDDGKQGEYDTNGGCTPNEYQEGDSCPTVPNGPKDGIIENGVCVGGDDTSDCTVINQENADECGYEISSDGQLIPKDLSGDPNSYPTYVSCGGGIFAQTEEDCPNIVGTGGYSEEEKSIAESIKDWVEGKIGEVKDMTADDVLEAVFGGSGGYTCELTGEGEEPWDCAGTDGSDGNQCWKDCVSASVLAGIPGLPMPPGAVDIGTVRDLENTANDIGTTIGNILNPDPDDESFIQKVKDWVTGKIDEIFGNTDDVTLEQITGWITGKLGNVLAGAVLIETADATNTVTTKINEILGLPITDPEDEKCIETEYFEANKEKCTALGYVDCDSEVGPNGEELAGGIKKGTISDCEVTGVSLSEEAELCKKTGREYDDLNDKCLEECEKPEYTILADGNCGIDADTPLTQCEDEFSTNYGEDGDCGPDCISGYSIKEGATTCSKDDTPELIKCPDDTPNAGQMVTNAADCGEPTTLIKCPDDTPNAGQMVTSLDECGTTPALVECPDGPDKGKMVTSLDQCGTTPALVECPQNTPNAGQMVDDKSKCGTSTTYTCPDPNATTNEDGSCGPCKTGYAYDGSVERCVQSTTPDPCLDAVYAAANEDICGTVGGDECVDCTCAEYAAANPEECATSPETPDGGGNGGGGMFRPQAGVPPTLGDPQLLARMEFPIENFLQQYIDGPDNQDISITGLFKDYV